MASIHGSRYAPGMARCDSESRYPAQGLGWRPPDLTTIRYETPRLVIRNYELSDIEAVFTAIEECRPHLRPWMGWAEKSHREIAETAQYIANQIMNTRKPETWENVGLGIFLKDGGTFVGATGVHDVRRDTASCETGYWIHALHRGKGYATEACRASISWALRAQDDNGLGLRRVRLFCSKENEASVRVIEKLGIRKELEMPDDYWVDGVGCTTRMGWGVMAGEWDARNNRTFCT